MLLARTCEFVEGEGPRLEPVRTEADLARLNATATRRKFDRVFETVSRVRQDLPPRRRSHRILRRAVDGGDLHGGRARHGRSGGGAAWAYRDAQGFQRLIDLLVERRSSISAGRSTAGAHVLQIFDSWAGSLPDDQFQRWVIAPTQVLVERVKARHPHVPIIGFPRGAGTQAAGYVTRTGVDGVGCDTAMPLALMAGPLAGKAVVQGNLDPLLLVAGGKAMEQRVAAILTALEGKRFIFNLGHGIVPQTPPENVARLVELVRRT